jgi:prepilin-type processing-associated H-X9-DG protein
VIRATEYEAQYGYEVGERVLLENGSYFSYGYNGFGNYTRGDTNRGNGLGVVATPTWSNINRMHELPASRVRVPEDMIAIADATADGHMDFLITFYRDSSDPADFASNSSIWPGKIHGVHQGGANVLFCDGHVQWYPQSDLTVDTSTEAFRPETWPRLRMWNNQHNSGIE